MSKPTMIRTIPTNNEAIKGFVHWCSGCNTAHRIVTRRNGVGKVHSFNGNYAAPTFDGTIQIHAGRNPDETVKDCTYRLQDGRLIYSADTHHKLRGKRVPLPPFPDNFLNEDELQQVVSFAA